MGVFGRNEKVDIVPTVNSDWIRNASTRNLITQWNEITLRFEEILTGNVLYYPEQQTALLDNLNLIKKEWMLIDRQLVSTEEAGLMFRVLNDDIPKLISRLGAMKAERSSLSANHEGNYLEISQKVKDRVSEVMKLRSKIDAQKLTRYTETNNGEVHQHLTSLTFPTYSELPSNVENKLNEVQKIWETLQEQVHAVEDEYLLERMVTDYIPNSVELFNAFKDANETMKAEAEKLLLNQLQLMVNRLATVQDKNLLQQMKAMNAQSDFLTNRLDEGLTL